MLIELFGELVMKGNHNNRKQTRCWPWMNEKLDKEVRDKVLLGQKPPELSLIHLPLVRELAEECLSFEAESRPSMKQVRARLLAAQLDNEEQAWINQLNSVFF